MNLKTFRAASTLFALIAVVAWAGCGTQASSKPLTKNGDHAPNLPAPASYTKVIVVGAGAAGLSAASVLEEQGIDYQIIEATSRYGGRVQKDDQFADFPIDLGAEWIHQRKEILNQMVDSSDQEIAIELIPYQTLDSFTWDGTRYEKMSPILGRVAYWNNPEHKFKNTTWFDYLEKNFANQVKDNIVFNSPVVEIDYSGDRVKAVTQQGEVYSADHLILTVSIGVLQSESIRFIPELPKEKREAFNGVEFYGGFKLLLKFNQCFYPDMIVCDTELGEKTYYDLAYQKDSQDHILALLSMGSSAENYYQLDSEQQVVETVLKELDLIFDGAASDHYTGEYRLHDWGRHPYTLGTWTHDLDESTHEKVNAPLNGKVFFAGESHEEDHWSTVPGAVLSGKAVANQLLKSIRKKKPSFQQ